MSGKREVIKIKIYYEIDILEIPCKKKHFIEYGIGSIISLFIFFMSIIFTLIYLYNDIAYLFSIIGIISGLIGLPITLIYILWAPSNVKIGYLNDNS